ncbi:MAG: heavy metal-binding domain-containing protein [Bdellovibrionales bacterium]|nr:heavy metal-binding domain-containing protein [Bdellovibrionales bacterium]
MLGLVASISGLFIAHFYGKAAEARHYSKIRQAEQKYLHVPVLSMRSLPASAVSCTVVSASVCISDDFFKRVLARWKNILGGRLTSYESLLDRARREATNRLKQSTIEKGYLGVIDFHLETVELFDEGHKSSLNTVQVVARGTAFR